MALPWSPPRSRRSPVRPQTGPTKSPDRFQACRPQQASRIAAIKQIVETIGQVSSIAAQITTAVEQQGSATQEIARNVQNVAKSTQDVALNITEVNRGATETGPASSEVLHSAKTRSVESGRLRQELDQFMATIRAA